MPSVMVYIKQQDYDKWLAIEKKSEWLHKALNGRKEHLEKQLARVEKIAVDKLEAASVKPFVPKTPDPETGYPCCLANKPCKHWHFDGDKQLWQNEITGKTKEPGVQ